MGCSSAAVCPLLVNLTSFPNPAVHIHTDGAEDVHDGENRSHTNTSKVHKIRVRSISPNPEKGGDAEGDAEMNIALREQNKHADMQ